MGHTKLTNRDHSQNWPNFLKRVVNTYESGADVYQPIIIDMSKRNSEKKLEELIQSSHISHVSDDYDEQLAELFTSQDAHLYRANREVQASSITELLKEHYNNKPNWKLGSWVYFPWSGDLIHILSKELFNDLRTIRNRDLITKQEQAMLGDFSIACLGMSVGSSSALALTFSGISSHIKLVDGAVISGSNLNRILTGITSIGENKALVIQKQIYTMNPYMQVEAFQEHISQENIKTIFESPWPIKLVIDEMDDLEMKIRLRIEARSRKIPVLMATELADNIMLDVERFDLDNNTPLFHGLVKNIERVLEKDGISNREWMKYATAIIGPENVPLDMQESLLKVGTKVVTHPQLGATAMMTGGVLAFAAKQIALGKNLPSQRTSISLSKHFKPDHRSSKHKKDHKKHTKILKRNLEAI